MDLVISDDLLLSTRMSAPELTQEIAVMLFEKDKLTLGQAARLAQMSRLRFQHLLASRGIPIHYDVAQLEHDWATLQQLGTI